MQSKKYGILVGGEKGGSGKSTIATNLAVMFTLQGYDTILVDCDKQQTSLKFVTRRSSQGIKPNVIATHLSGNQLQIPLADLYEKYQVVIVDCGGQDSVELRSSMITPCMTQMIIPVRPGYFDLETLVNMNSLVKTSLVYNQNLKAKCIINCASTNKQVTVSGEAKEFIESELDSLGIFQTILHDRVGYSYAVAKGESVVEFEERNKRDSKASEELKLLFKELTKKEFCNKSVLEKAYA